VALPGKRKSLCGGSGTVAAAAAAARGTPEDELGRDRVPSDGPAGDELGR